jgi:acetyl esterase/lipase
MKHSLSAGLAGAIALVLGPLAAPTPAAAEGEPAITPDVVYGHKDGMALIYDVIRPANANGAGVLFMASGGWVSFWRPPEARVGGYQALLDAGFTVFTVYHGSSPRYRVPDAVGDARRAVRHIRAHADEYGVDADRLGVYGGSAGGHLSLLLGLAGDDGDPAAADEIARVSSRVAAVVAFFPVTDLRAIAGPSERFPALDFDPALAADISPILFVDGEDPPTLILHGDADELVPVEGGIRMHETLAAAGATTEIVVYEGAGHGFRGEDQANAMAVTAAWFEEHLAR